MSGRQETEKARIDYSWTEREKLENKKMRYKEEGGRECGSEGIKMRSPHI